MIEPKVNYALLGLFVLVLGAGLIGVGAWLSAGGNGEAEYDPYVTYVESVSGLKVNAPVTYRGVEVGRVRGIALDARNPEQVCLSLEILHGTPIKMDTVATLSAQGLTGIAFIDLSGGIRDAALLRATEDGTPPIIRSGPSLLSRFDDAITKALASFTRLAGELHSLLDDENRAAVSDILRELRTLSATLVAHDEEIDQVLSNAARALEHGAAASAKLPELVEQLRRNMAAFEGITQQYRVVGEDIGALVRDGHALVQPVARELLPEARALLDNIEGLTADLRRLTRMLEREPNSLLFGKHREPPGPGE